MTKATPKRQAEVVIADFVRCLPLEYLPKLVLPEIVAHGPLPGGYSQRWSEMSIAGRKHDADILARGAERINMSGNPWPPDSTSSTSRETSESGKSDKNRPPSADRQGSDKTVRRGK